MTELSEICNVQILYSIFNVGCVAYQFRLFSALSIMQMQIYDVCVVKGAPENPR